MAHSNIYQIFSCAAMIVYKAAKGAYDARILSWCLQGCALPPPLNRFSFLPQLLIATILRRPLQYFEK
jgi:hypothetical protein